MSTSEWALIMKETVPESCGFLLNVEIPRHNNTHPWGCNSALFHTTSNVIN